MKATLSDVRATVKARWGYASPYRMGLVAHELGYLGGNPYGKNSTGNRLFRDGLRAAIATETRRAETENTGSVEDEGAGLKGIAQPPESTP